MQNGRNNRWDGRVPIPINRGTTGYAAKLVKNVESDKKAQQQKAVGKPGATSVINLPDDGKVKSARKFGATNVSNIPTKLRGKPTKTDENRVSQSIQKLLSVYENDEKSCVAKSKISDEGKSKIYGKTSRYNVTRTPERPAVDKTHGKRVSSVLSEKAKIYNAEEKQWDGKGMRNNEGGFPTRKILQKRKATPVGSAAKMEKPPFESITKSMIVSAVTRDKKNYDASENGTLPTDQLIPIMTPEHHVRPCVNIINSIITNYLEENAQDRPLDFLLTGCEDNRGNVFPVCSKRATDNIPSSEMTSVIQDGHVPEKRDLIIMLRRRNSEPYSPRNYLLQYADLENQTAWNLERETFDNYYFWEPGPNHRFKPYWEVSLFKSNRSLSVMTSRAASGMLSLTQGSDTSEILQAGRFNSRKTVAETKPSWLREISSFSDDQMETMPFITLMEKGRILPREPQVKPKEDPREERAAPPRRQPRLFSKDDHYKPPGHLLIYVKSSQKKLVTVDAYENHPDIPVNRKVHKLTKIRRINSEIRPPWHKKIVVTAATALLLVIGAFLFLFYFLTKSHSFFNLTPPIPGLVRGC